MFMLRLGQTGGRGGRSLKPYNIVLAVCLLSVLPVTAQPTLEFKQLPKEVTDHAIEVRNSCREYSDSPAPNAGAPT